MEKLVSTKIFEHTARDLKSLKVHSRQPNSEVIDKAVTLFKSFKSTWTLLSPRIPSDAFPEGMKEQIEKLLNS